MKVFIYSIPRESAFGIHDWTSDSSGRKLNKTKLWKCTDKITALYNSKHGGLSNGLSYKPWIENGQEIKDEQGNTLTLQDKMEQKWGLSKGYLTNKLNTREDIQQRKSPNYYVSKSWKLNDGCTVLDLDKFDDEMFYYVALDSKYIANSEAEYRKFLWPKAQYYIALENEAEEIKHSKNVMKSKAFGILHSENMVPTNKLKICTILELSNSLAELTNEQVDNLLFEFIDKSTFTPGSNIEKLMGVASLLDTPDGRERLDARYLLKQALDTRVIHEKQGAYNWIRPSGNITVGENYNEAIDFLLNPKKEVLVSDLKAEIKLRSVR